MKITFRVLALMLILALSCAALPAAAGGFNFGAKPAATEAPKEVPQQTPESVDIAGCWEFFAYDISGEPTTDLTGLDLQDMLLLYEDGTGYHCVYGNKQRAIDPVTWSQHEAYVDVFSSSGGGDVTYILVDDQLVCLETTHVRYYHKISWPVDNQLTGVSAGKEAIFAGAWKFCALDASAYGIPAILPSIVFSTQFRMDISEGTMALMQTNESDEGSRVFLFQADFEDGLLRVTPVPTEGQSSVTIQMYENGWISMGMIFNDTSAVLYFSRQPAEGGAPALPVPKSMDEIAGAMNVSYDGGAADASDVSSSPASSELRYDGQYIYLWTDPEGNEMISIIQLSPDGKMMHMHSLADRDQLDILRIFFNLDMLTANSDESSIYPYTFENGIVTCNFTDLGYQLEYELLGSDVLRSRVLHEVYGKDEVTLEYEEYVFMPFE